MLRRGVNISAKSCIGVIMLSLPIPETLCFQRLSDFTIIIGDAATQKHNILCHPKK